MHVTDLFCETQTAMCLGTRSFGEKSVCPFGDLGSFWGPSPEFGDSWHLYTSFGFRGKLISETTSFWVLKTRMHIYSYFLIEIVSADLFLFIECIQNCDGPQSSHVEDGVCNRESTKIKEKREEGMGYYRGFHYSANVDCKQAGCHIWLC